MKDDYKPENALAYAFAVIVAVILFACVSALLDYFTAYRDVYAIAEGR